MSTVIIKPGREAEEKPNWLDVVQRHVGSLRYGVVQIIIHDSQVTQIEKTERVRLDRSHCKSINADQKTAGKKNPTYRQPQ